MLGASIGWKDLAATIRWGQCQHEAEQQGVEMAPWYYMSATLGEGGHTPYHPLLDDVPMEESQPVDTEETIVATRLDGIVAVEEKAVDRCPVQSDL